MSSSANMTMIMAFHKLLTETIDIIANKFPLDKEIQYTKSQIDMSTNMSPRYAVVSFMEEIRPYKQKIDNRDEDFFIRKSCTEITISSLNLSEKWNEFSSNDKERLWNNVKKLMKLGEKILEF